MLRQRTADLVVLFKKLKIEHEHLVVHEKIDKVPPGLIDEALAWFEKFWDKEYRYTKSLRDLQSEQLWAGYDNLFPGEQSSFREIRLMKAARSELVIATSRSRPRIFKKGYVDVYIAKQSRSQESKSRKAD